MSEEESNASIKELRDRGIKISLPDVYQHLNKLLGLEAVEEQGAEYILMFRGKVYISLCSSISNG